VIVTFQTTHADHPDRDSSFYDIICKNYTKVVRDLTHRTANGF